MEEWKDVDAENARKLDEMDGGYYSDEDEE